MSDENGGESHWENAVHSAQDRPNRRHDHARHLTDLAWSELCAEAKKNCIHPPIGKRTQGSNAIRGLLDGHEWRVLVEPLVGGHNYSIIMLASGGRRAGTRSIVLQDNSARQHIRKIAKEEFRKYIEEKDRSAPKTLATPSAAELRDRRGFEVVSETTCATSNNPMTGYCRSILHPFFGVAASDSTTNGEGIRTVTVPLGEPPERTVAEKWAEHLGDRAANLEWMAEAAGTQLGGHEWCTARTQLCAMRDEIDQALAEIEPLAVEQGGRDE